MSKTLLKKLAAVFVSLESEKEVEDFLRALLTPKELDELPTRLEIVRRLKKGEAQRKISEDLGVGIATITRGSREIKKGGFKSIS